MWNLSSIIKYLLQVSWTEYVKLTPDGVSHLYTRMFHFRNYVVLDGVRKMWFTCKGWASFIQMQGKISISVTVQCNLSRPLNWEAVNVYLQ
jgi:hypothetical protein